jgi:hypothetical protein
LKWVIDKSDLSVISGQDLSEDVFLWENGAYAEGTTAFGRLCSADLPALSAFYNAASGNGYNGRIFMDGEEIGAEGLGFGHLTNGELAAPASRALQLGELRRESVDRRQDRRRRPG